ncbi:MAG: magnetochrome domain-containing protein [Candidatus Omnitrophota bacterium]
MAKKSEGAAFNIDLKSILAKVEERFKDTDLNVIFIFSAIVLILIVGTYALFSAESTGTAKGNPACGMIVIATGGRSLAAPVAPTLSEARYFLVVNPLNKKLMEVVKNPYFGQGPSQQMTYLIASKGEEAVIVGSVDQQTYNTLSQFGIRVFGGYQGRAQKVISLYRQARIPASPMPGQAQQIPVQQQMQMQGMAPVGGMGGGMAANMPMGMQGNMMQQGMGMQNMPMNYMMQAQQPTCPLPGGFQGIGMLHNGNGPGYLYQQQILQQQLAQQQAMAQGGAGAMQAGWFGWGQRAYVCPICNWRMKSSQQGDGFPQCPNCGGSMALDMQAQNQNRLVNPFVEQPEMQMQNQAFGQQAMAQQAMAQQAMGQQAMMMGTQANFFSPNPDMTNGFKCPNCGWLMHSEQGMNEFPRCPNCGQIMKRVNPASRIAMVQNAPVANPVPNSAPPIFRDAVMPHQFRGVCENCHTVKPDITIAANATMPHAYRGVCSNCHQIAPAQAVQAQPVAMQNVPMQQQAVENEVAQNNGMQDPNVAHMAIK